MMDFEESLKDGHLKKIRPNLSAAEKEFKSADYDFARARQSLKEDDDKWASVKAYYSMFHAAKALLFAVGIKERSHSAVQAALEELSKKGVIESIHVVNFAAAREAREDSDYRGTYSRKTAEDVTGYAEDFLQDIHSAVNKLKPKGKNVK